MSLLWYGIATILLSLVAVPSLILSKKPNAKELLDKIAPFQGWAGIFFCILGIWILIDGITSIGWMGTHIIFTIAWIIWVSCGLVMIILGFMLGYNLIVQYALSKNEKTAEKGAQLQAKLAGIQGKVGFFGIIAGLAAVVFWIYIRFFLF